MSPHADAAERRHAAVREVARRLDVSTAYLPFIARIGRGGSLGAAGLVDELWEGLVVAGLLPSDLARAEPVWARGGLAVGGCLDTVEAAALAAHWPAVEAAAAATVDLLGRCAAWGRAEELPRAASALPFLLKVETRSPVELLAYNDYVWRSRGLKNLLGPAGHLAAIALRQSGGEAPAPWGHTRSAPATELDWQAAEVGWAAEALACARARGLSVPEPQGGSLGGRPFRDMLDPTSILLEWNTWGLLFGSREDRALVVGVEEIG